MKVTEHDFKKMMGQFTTGVAIITTQHEGKPVGVTINTLTSVSLDPPLILFCLGNHRRVYSAFFENPNTAIHILSSDQHELCRAFAHPHRHPWEGMAYHMSEAGCPLLPNSLGILHCRREQMYQGGDHTIFLNHVNSLHWENDHEKKDPLIYFKGGLS